LPTIEQFTLFYGSARIIVTTFDQRQTDPDYQRQRGNALYYAFVVGFTAPLLSDQMADVKDA
jgi:hypothetical protein